MYNHIEMTSVFAFCINTFSSRSADMVSLIDLYESVKRTGFAKCSGSDRSANPHGPLLSFDTFWNSEWLCMWTVKAIIRLRELAG